MTWPFQPVSSTLPSVLGDPTALMRLGQIAGPEAGRELFARLEEDLESVRTGLARAAAQTDMAAMRHQSHILIGLAGTTGAQTLYENAVSLNEMVHRPEPTKRIVTLAKKLDAPVRQLIAEVRAVADRMANGVDI